MPAITHERRFALEPVLAPLLEAMYKNRDGLKDGDVTYLITKIVVRFVRCKGKSYDSLKDVDGILDTAREEFYRQITAPYEAKKFKENDPEDFIYGEIRD